MAGQSDYAEKFRYATILRGLYARVEILLPLNWIGAACTAVIVFYLSLFFFFSFFGISYVWKSSAVVFWGNWDDYYDGIYVEYEFHVQHSNGDDRLWTYRNFLVLCTIGRSLHVRDDILLLLNRIGHSLHVIVLFLFLWSLDWYLILSYFIAIKRKPYEYDFCSHVSIELSWGIKLFIQFYRTITRK